MIALLFFQITLGYSFLTVAPRYATREIFRVNVLTAPEAYERAVEVVGTLNSTATAIVAIRFAVSDALIEEKDKSTKKIVEMLTQAKDDAAKQAAEQAKDAALKLSKAESKIDQVEAYYLQSIAVIVQRYISYTRIMNLL